MKLDPIVHQIDFKHRRALVTGAGKGIGREMASMLTRFNARVIALSRTEKDLQSLTEEIGCTVDAWDLTMAVNLRSVAIISQVIATQMIERGVRGSIVNVSSMAAFQALEKHAAYCASKAGLDQLTKVMAVELGKHGIRVNSVNPTVVLTEMGKRAWSDPEKGGPMLQRIPLGRFAECADIASVVCFLLSDAAAMLNGLALPIDGGFLAT